MRLAGRLLQPQRARHVDPPRAAQVVGGTPKVVVRFTAEAEKKGLSVAEATERQRTDQREERKREALSHPRVQEALQIFPEGAGNVKVHVDVD